MIEKTVSINQAAEITGVSRRTIYNWINSGKLKYIRLVSGTIRIEYSSLFIPNNTETVQVRRERLKRELKANNGSINS